MISFLEWLLENQLPVADEPQGGVLGKYAFNQDRDDTMDFDFPPDETTDLEVRIYGMLNDWITSYTPMDVRVLEQMYQLARQGKYKKWFQIPNQSLYRGTLYSSAEVAKAFGGQVPGPGTYNVQMNVLPGSPKQPGMQHSAWSKDGNVATNFARRSGKAQGMSTVVFVAQPTGGRFLDLAPFAGLFSAHTARYAGGEAEVTAIGTVQASQITVL